MGSLAVVPSREVTVRSIGRISFSILTHEEVKRISVKQLTNPTTMDSAGTATVGGLYDPALGLFMNARTECETCGLSSAHCPGHFGHIELPVPMYNPLLLKELVRLLKVVCLSCHHIRITEAMSEAFKRKVRLLIKGELAAACAVTPGRKRQPLKGKRGETRCDNDERGGDGVDDNENGDDDEGKYICVPNGHNGKGRQRMGHTLTSMVLMELQSAQRDLFKSVDNSSCPRCGCVAPKIKRVNKFTFVLHPLTPNKAARNALNGHKIRVAGVDATKELSRAGHDEHSQAADAVDGQADDQDGAEDDDDDDNKDGAEEDEDKQESEPDDGEDGDMYEKDATNADTEDKTTAAVNKSEARKRKRATSASSQGHSKQVDEVPTGKPQFLDQKVVHELISSVWARDGELLDLLYQSLGLMRGGSGCPRTSPDLLFLHSVLVTPNKFRPASEMGEEKFEHPHNLILMKLLQAVTEMGLLAAEVKSQRMQAGSPEAKQLFLTHGRAIQNQVNQLMDTSTSEEKDGLLGVRQLLERKEGLFRMNMMGKRVNFAARSVISPDPNIDTGEIGVPPYFASRLSFPEPVTHLNFKRLSRMVSRGPDQHPGAVAVEDVASGVVTTLHHKTQAEREAIAANLLKGGGGARVGRSGKKSKALDLMSGPARMIVYRHVCDGDILLTNRQPTLHKPGLMAHRARVLYGERTIRMHYANCSTFNADFDGDEINLHLPQEHMSRAEGYVIVHADHQFKVPTDGKPARGLIQDHVVAAVLLTKRDTFLTRPDFLQLCSVACRGTAPESAAGVEDGKVGIVEEDALLLPLPAVLLPQPLWTGKQVLNVLLQYHTAGLPLATYRAGAKVADKHWGRDPIASESSVYMREGYLCHGTFDKAQYGKKGFLHAIQELYGGSIAGAVTSALSRVLTLYIQMHGFTCGMGDLLLMEGGEKARETTLAEAEACAIHTGSAMVGVEDKLPQGFKTMSSENQIVFCAEQVVRAGLRSHYRQSSKFAEVHDQRCASALNPCASRVIAACFPAGLCKPFLQNCMSLMTLTGAKGSLVNFGQIAGMLGQQELEGRRVPRMAVGKTLPCFHPFDAGARSCGFIADRFLSGLRPQEYYFHCMAGREGLVDTAVKTARSGYLQRCIIKSLEALTVAYDATVRDTSDRSIVQFAYGEDGLDVLNTSFLCDFEFLKNNRERIAQDLDAAAVLGVVANDPRTHNVDAQWTQRQHALKELVEQLEIPSLDDHTAVAKAVTAAEFPCIAAEMPRCVLGAVSERYADSLFAFAEHSGVNDRAFWDAMMLRYMRSTVDAGEAVGVLAGQSIGEPSTQMTLNTFHMAGRGEANVTLGIPRLRELLTTASKSVRTPVMQVPMQEGCSGADVASLAATLRPLRLVQCLQALSMDEHLFYSNDNDRTFSHTYVIHLQFHALEQLPHSLDLKWDELEGAVDRFRRLLGTKVQAQLRRAAAACTVHQAAAERNSSAPGKANEAADGEAGEAGEADDKSEKAKEPQQAQAWNDMEESENEDENAEVNEEFHEAKDSTRGQEQPTYETTDDEEDDDVAARGAPAPRDDADADTALASTEANEQPNSTQPGAGKESTKSRAKKRASSSVDNLSTSFEMDKKSQVAQVKLNLPLSAPSVLVLEEVEAAVVATLVRAVPGIEGVYVLEADETTRKTAAIQTDGINFDVIRAQEHIVDIDGVTCNDVRAMLDVYGVEAARATLVHEVNTVFQLYGITVDPRHLALIGDYMTQSGTYRACNRLGMASCTSPLLKMSFETSAAFLTDAAVSGAVDEVESAAARIVLGRPVGLGTGIVSVRMELDVPSY